MANPASIAYNIVTLWHTIIGGGNIMSFVEITLIIFMAILIYQLANYSPHQSICLMRFFVLTGGIIMIHTINHPDRWQFWGLYLIFILLLAYYLFKKHQRKLTRISKGLAIFATIVLIITIILALAFPIFKLPQAQGSYSIGSKTYHLVNEQTSKLLTPQSNDHRPMTIQVWYPSDQDTSQLDPLPYIEDAETLLPALTQEVGIPEFTLNYLQRVQSHAYVNLPLTTKQEKLPVVIFLSGNLGFKAVNTLQMEFLAANGFVVISVDQARIATGVKGQNGQVITSIGRQRLHDNSQLSIQSQPDIIQLEETIEYPGGLVQYLAQDVSFIIDQLELMNQGKPVSQLKLGSPVNQRFQDDQDNHTDPSQSTPDFTNRLNLHEITVAGVSLGAINTAQACANDNRIANCILIDAPVPAQVAETGLKQNLLIITRPQATMKAEQAANGS